MKHALERGRRRPAPMSAWTGLSRRLRGAPPGSRGRPVLGGTRTALRGEGGARCLRWAGKLASVAARYARRGARGRRPGCPSSLAIAVAKTRVASSEPVRSRTSAGLHQPKAHAEGGPSASISRARRSGAEPATESRTPSRIAWTTFVPAAGLAEGPKPPHPPRRRRQRRTRWPWVPRVPTRGRQGPSAIQTLSTIIC